MLHQGSPGSRAVSLSAFAHNELAGRSPMVGGLTTPARRSPRLASSGAPSVRGGR